MLRCAENVIMHAKCTHTYVSSRSIRHWFWFKLLATYNDIRKHHIVLSDNRTLPTNKLWGEDNTPVLCI